MYASKSRPEMPGFIQTQFAFAGAVRDPQNGLPPSDIEPRRMALYQELIYTNIEDFLSNAFPVLRRISSDNNWHALVRDFIVEHRATTPLFPEMPREFLAYLENERGMREHDFPFMLELAHYEWAELALGISEESIEAHPVDDTPSLLQDIPVISPLVWLCSYRYPVHRIGPDFIPEQPGEILTHLMVYRDRNDEVGFMELNPVTSQLLQQLQQQNEKSGEQLLHEIADAIQHPNPDTVITGGLQIMQDLLQRGIILGTRTMRKKS